MSDDAEDFAEPKLPLTVDSPIAWAEVLVENKALREYYDANKVKCWDCCAAEIETFKDGAKVHEGGPYGAFDAQKVVDDLNELAKKHPFDPTATESRGLFRRFLDSMF